MLRAINDARVVTPDGVVENASVVLEGAAISGLSRHPERSGEVLDAAGRYVLPGFVDLHCDAIEKQLFPRPEVGFPPKLAFMEIDRQLAAAGITTGLHALSFVEEPGRTVALGLELHALILRHRREGLVRHELHLRCELPQERSVEAVADALTRRGIRMVALADHRPGQGKYRDPAWFRRLYIKAHGEADDAKVATAFREAVLEGEAQPDPQWLDRVIRAAKEGGAVLASHDDTAETVESLAGKGVQVSEFPIDAPSARRAKDLGLSVCMGAPNVVRGRSHGGSISATEAARLGLVDALCSDYHPPSVLQAAFKLAGEGALPLHEAVGLVSSGPARAVGLVDRGEVREGALADLTVVGERFGLPSVTHTIVGGEVVLASEVVRENGAGAP